MAGGVRGRGHAWWGVCLVRGHAQQGDVHGGGCAWQGACVAGEMATAAGVTHPTGMHPCFSFTFVIYPEIYGLLRSFEGN